MKAGVEHIIPLSAGRSRYPSQPSYHWRLELMFTNDGRKPITNFSKPKLELDRRSGIKDWVLHDLRRSARSLMSRGGVLPDVAERCLAHSIGGIRGVYDRHAYIDESESSSKHWQRRIVLPSVTVRTFWFNTTCCLSNT